MCGVRVALCAMANGSTTKSHGRVLYDNSNVLVGGKKATHKLDNWPCSLCGISNGSQYGVCYGKTCSGLPSKQYMGLQAEAQKKWSAENALVPGAAPHVPSGSRKRKPAVASPKDPASDDLRKKLQAAETRAKKAEAQLKQNGNGKPKALATKAPPQTDEEKELEKKVKGFTTALAVDPENEILKKCLKDAEAAREAAKPAQVLDLAQLHGELNELEDQVKVGMSWIHKKNAVYESIKKQIITKVASVHEIEAKAEALRATIAERTVVASPVVVPAAPCNLDTVHLSAYFERLLCETKKVTESTLLSESAKKKAALIQGHWDTVTAVQKAFSELHFEVSAELAYVTTEMPPDVPCNAPASPDKAAGSDGTRIPLLEPDPPQPVVPSVFVPAATKVEVQGDAKDTKDAAAAVEPKRSAEEESMASFKTWAKVARLEQIQSKGAGKGQKGGEGGQDGDSEMDTA